MDSISLPHLGQPIGDDSLLSLQDVQDLLGCGEVTASKVLREAGIAIRVHSRLYCLQSSLLAYLRKQQIEEVA